MQSDSYLRLLSYEIGWPLTRQQPTRPQQIAPLQESELEYIETRLKMLTQSCYYKLQVIFFPFLLIPTSTHATH
jgi:hypothetical protein